MSRYHLAKGEPLGTSACSSTPPLPASLPAKSMAGAPKSRMSSSSRVAAAQGLNSPAGEGSRPSEPDQSMMLIEDLDLDTVSVPFGSPMCHAPIVVPDPARHGDERGQRKSQSRILGGRPPAVDIVLAGRPALRIDSQFSHQFGIISLFLSHGRFRRWLLCQVFPEPISVDVNDFADWEEQSSTREPHLIICRVSHSGSIASSAGRVDKPWLI